jgi:hypothetical protein
MNDKLQVPATLIWQKSPQYPLDRSLGEPQYRFGRRGEEDLDFDLSAVQSVANCCNV